MKQTSRMIVLIMVMPNLCCGAAESADTPGPQAPGSLTTGRRPAYQAPGRYGDTQFVAAFFKRHPSWYVCFRTDTLSHASFSESLLVRSKHYLQQALLGFVFSGRSGAAYPHRMISSCGPR